MDNSASVPSTASEFCSGLNPSITSGPDVTGTKDSAKSKILGLFKRASESAPSYIKKRPRSPDPWSSKSILSNTPQVTKEPANKRLKHDSILGPIGIAKSSVQAKKTRDAAKRGELKIKEAQEKRWKETMTTIDPHVEFFDKNVSAARHFNCGKVIKVKQPYDTTRFSVHANGCKGAKKKSNTSGGSATLFQMASRGKWNVTVKVSQATASEERLEDMPCRGLSEVDHKLIPEYLRRTAAKGGGSRSIAKIAMEKYGKTFSLLAQNQKKVVDDLQVHEQQWRNDHAKLRVFSTSCKRSTHIRNSNDSEPFPCTGCQALLNNNQFKISLRKPMPESKNYKFINRRHQEPLLGELYARTKGLQDLIESSVHIRHHI